MVKTYNIKVVVSQRIDTHPYIEQLYSKVKEKGVVVYAPGSKVDFFRKLIKANIIHWLVITLHNIKPHEILHPHLESVSFKLSLKLADAVIVHNNYAKEMVNKVYGIATEKVSVIPHGNFVSYYPNYITREEARARLAVSENRFVLLFFGMIWPYKGLENLIDALKSILTYNEDLLIMIVGKCSAQYLREALHRFSNDFPRNCIIKLQHIPDEGVQLYMNACDIGILPYKEVTTSGSLLLFMSFGKPVIVPQLEPIRETVGDLGVYYDPKKKGSLESVITKSRDLDLATISRKMFEKASEYNWDEISDSTAGVYSRVL